MKKSRGPGYGAIAAVLAVLLSVFAWLAGTGLGLGSPDRLDSAVGSPSESLSGANPTGSVSTASSESNRAATAPKALPVRALPGIPVGSPSLPDTNAAPPRAIPDGNVIEARIVDGWAVTYGDVLIGKPEGDFQGDRGLFEAPTPQLWERPEIPYAIHPQLPAPERVEQALAYLRQHTPVNFVPYQGQKDAVLFEPTERNCYSYLGRVGGVQPIRLSAGCQASEILHEVMHALGFVHEQSRPDRDQYIEVLWGNIEEEFHDQYYRVPESFTEILRGAGFDFRSTMLYRPNTFARDPRQPTMRSRGADSIEPTRTGLSEGDISRLNRLYQFHE